VITGAFSITQQAMQLGYTPRFEVQHTSDSQIGQIYLPASTGCCWGVIALVLGFGSSSNMAAAYGIAVTGTMLITNLLAIAVAVAASGSGARGARVLGALPFIIIDLGFFLANSVKIPTVAGSRWCSAGNVPRCAYSPSSPACT
jgi:KUP system potassium uptake protein